MIILGELEDYDFLAKIIIFYLRSFQKLLKLKYDFFFINTINML